eukprot:g4407.t1
MPSSPSSALSCNIDAFGTKCFDEPLSRVIFHRGVRRFSFLFYLAFIYSSRSHSTRHLTPSYNRLQTPYGGGNCRALSRSNIRSLSFPALSIACIRASQLISIHSPASVVGLITRVLLYLGIIPVLPVSGRS